MTSRDRTPPPLLGRTTPEPLLGDDGSLDGPGWLRVLLALAAAGAAGGLVLLLLSIPERPPLLPAMVEAELEASGVSSRVTAVLLNFRAYDTLLEVVVLAVAMVAVWSMDRGSRQFARDPLERDDRVLLALARLAVPLVGVTAVYLAWAGSFRPGGAFQAGALLAGAGVLLAAGGFIPPLTAGSRLVRSLVAAGIYVFVGVGIGVMPWTGAFLAYPAEWAYPLILGVEAVLTVVIAIVLVELFVDVPAVPRREPTLDRLDPTGDPLGRLVEWTGPARDPERAAE